jgi:hypothetical protein
MSGGGFVDYRDLGDCEGADLDHLIAGRVRAFSGRGESPEWKVYGHDRPADLSERLLAAGVVEAGEELACAAATETNGILPLASEVVRVLRLDEDHQGLGQHAVVLHRLGSRRGLHRSREGFQVGHVHHQSDLGRVLRIDERPDVRNTERAEELLALRRGEPVLGVLHVVMADDGGHRISSVW